MITLTTIVFAYLTLGCNEILAKISKEHMTLQPCRQVDIANTIVGVSIGHVDGPEVWSDVEMWEITTYDQQNQEYKYAKAYSLADAYMLWSNAKPYSRRR